MVYYDSHCHAEFMDEAVFHECKEKGIKIVSVSEDMDSFNQVLKLREGNAIYKHFLGFHPDRVTPDNLGAVEEVLRYIKSSRVDGIGEVGLDFHPRFIEHKDLQVKVFKRLLERAERRKLPLSIHSRRAHSKVLDMLEGFRVNAALHWFSGGKKEFRRAIAGAYFIGFTPAILNSKGYKRLVEITPINLILTESDAPVFNRTPLMIPQTVRRIADIKDISMEDAIEGIAKNHERFLQQLRP